MNKATLICVCGQQYCCALANVKPVPCPRCGKEKLPELWNALREMTAAAARSQQPALDRQEVTN